MTLSVQMFAFNTTIAAELKERIAALAADPVKFAAGFNPSEYQQRIFDWIANSKGSAVVKAVAGSGKTTTLIHGLRYIRGVDLSQVRAGTFHSVGFNALCRKLNMKPGQVKADGSKVRKILQQELLERDYTMYGDFCFKLVGLAKGQGIGPLTPDVESAWYELISHHDLFLDDEAATEERGIDIARKALRRSNELANSGCIDFDDMLYLPLVWKLKLWQNDWVIVDEAQDTNPVRRAMAKLALRPGGRLMAVGDDKQAIYGFTGASHDAMDLIRHEFAAIDLPLTVSYRCARSVVAKAQEIVPYIEAAPNAIEGKVSEMALEEALKVLGPHDAILCRNTAPLIELAYTLIAQGVGCKVLGRDIGEGLINLIKRMKAKDIDSLVARLEQYSERETAKFMAKGEEQKAEAISDRVSCVMVVIEHLPEDVRTITALISRIEGMFSDTNGVLVLATQHKSKGKEWQTVAILDPWRNPSKWARQQWQRVQEENIQYVAWTRAKEHLIFLTDRPAKKAKSEQTQEAVTA